MLPLEGFRVLDLTHVLAGPCATHHLRCMGAEVIKIERPDGGDPMRALDMQPALGGLTPGFRALNAGKKSVVIDLAKEEGRALPGGSVLLPEISAPFAPTSSTARSRAGARAGRTVRGVPMIT